MVGLRFIEYVRSYTRRLAQTLRHASEEARFGAAILALAAPKLSSCWLMNG
jgi:hypothetical protein